MGSLGISNFFSVSRLGVSPERLDILADDSEKVKQNIHQILHKSKAISGTPSV